MTRSTSLETSSTLPGDPHEAFASLADEAGATAIAAQARNVAERLDANRLRVSVVGDPAILAPLLDHASRGVRFAVRAAAARWPAGRVDLAIVDDATASELHQVDGSRGILTYAVDLRDRRGLASTIELVERIANEVGADRVDALIAAHYRLLCRQLWTHLAELKRALERGDSDTLGRVNTLAIARVLAESAFDARTERPNVERRALVEWLGTERTKFLMATTADAAIELDRRIAQVTGPRARSCRDAQAAAHDLAAELLARLWQRLRADADKRLLALSKLVLGEVDAALGELAAPLPLDGIARVGWIRGYRRNHASLFATGSLTALAARVGLTGRRKLELAAREELVARLDTESLRLTTRILDEYDERTTVLEQRVFELIDGAVESIHVADERANQAQAAGADAIARARASVADWIARLGEIFDRLG